MCSFWLLRCMSSPPLSCKAYRSFRPRGIFSQNGAGYSPDLMASYQILTTLHSQHRPLQMRFRPTFLYQSYINLISILRTPRPARACKPMYTILLTNVHDLTHFTICFLNPQGTFRFSVTNSLILFDIFPIFSFNLNLSSNFVTFAL